MPELYVTVPYETVATPADMVTALTEALGHGWHGTITALRQGDTDMWALVMTTPVNNSPVTVTLGDVLLWDGTTYQCLDQATFTARYGQS
jgi:hypothetical protein